MAAAESPGFAANESDEDLRLPAEDDGEEDEELRLPAFAPDSDAGSNCSNRPSDATASTSSESATQSLVADEPVLPEPEHGVQDLKICFGWNRRAGNRIVGQVSLNPLAASLNMNIVLTTDFSGAGGAEIGLHQAIAGLHHAGGCSIHHVTA